MVDLTDEIQKLLIFLKYNRALKFVYGFWQAKIPPESMLQCILHYFLLSQITHPYLPAKKRKAV